MARKKTKVSNNVRGISIHASHYGDSHGMIDYQDILELTTRFLRGEELSLKEIIKYYSLRARLYESAAKFMEGFNYRIGKDRRNFYFTPKGRDAERFRRKSLNSVDYARANLLNC